MILFFLKKNFCDGWDNMLSLIVTNLVALAAFAALCALVYLARGVPLLAIAMILAMCVVFSILAAAYGETAAKIARFDGVHIADFFRAIPRCAKDGALFGLMVGGAAAVVAVCVPFYFARRSLFGTAMAMLFVWALVIALLSLQWFVALRSLLRGGFRKSLKKCFIIFFDNTAFSIFMALYNLALLVFSALFCGFLPSIAGITLAQVNALRLRLYKYDWLESHPEYSSPKERKIIPWSSLLQDDRAALGPRKFKSFIFPWKE